jgi:hypothetical protein
VYEYDFGDSWIHDLRLEATLPINPRKIYPMCVTGKCSAPPEDCGGPSAFMANRQYRETTRMHVFRTAERLEAELGPEQFAFDAGCQLEIEESPEPGPPITVGLDGGYIRGRERRPGGTGCFEVIAGKSIPEEGQSRVFAGVGQIDMKPKRRLHEVLLLALHDWSAYVLANEDGAMNPPTRRLP